MTFHLFILAYLLLFLPVDLSSFTKDANAILQKQIKQGLVDYKGVQEDAETIEQLYQAIGKLSLADASAEEKKAFYINAYNIIVIHQIVQHFPVKSPMDIQGFFDKKAHQVAGEKLTLNALEKEKLLQPYQDPRLHFVLVCAAMSCPPLADFAYQANSLDQQLEKKTREALNNPQFIQVSHSKQQVALSQIFEWYQDDFTKNGQSVVNFINQYRDKKIPAQYQVTYYPYDWSLNEAS